METGGWSIGVDGCPGGWIAAIADPVGRLSWHFAPTFKGLLQAAPPASQLLVDMIIGLPDRQNPLRTCDPLARAALRPHGSRVFNAPPREALRGTTHAEASALTRANTGKGLSQQSFNLFHKIKELDACFDPRVREAHPELAFARLNGGRPIADSKKSERGRKIRLELLDAALPGSRAAYHLAEKHLARKQVKRDDSIDALGLCALAKRSHLLIPLPESAEMDALGHPMQIWT